MIKLFVLATVLLLSPVFARQPNVVVFLTDDQGWGDLSVNGNTDLATPHIDSLARDGIQFDRFFVCPVCSPTRAEFLTGRYHARMGVYSTSAGGERMNLEEKTIAQSFKAAGYATGAFGKWHNGMQAPYHPNSRGFDEFYGFCSGHWGNYFDAMLEHNGKTVWGEGFVVDDFTDKVMAFMETHREKPFFVYVPYNTPHSPMQVPDRWWDKFKDKDLKLKHREPKKGNELHKRAALAMCENIDYNVGRILEKLAELKLEEDTIVAYFCDNGPNGARWNGGMKGRKGSTDEGGVRSPLLIRWPGQIQAGSKTEQIASVIDLHATFADLAGVKPVNQLPLDGVSLKPWLLDQAVPTERDLFQQWKGRVSLRTHRYRLDTQGKLFDMIDDPGQTRAVNDEQPEIADAMKVRLQAFRAEMIKPVNDQRPFVLGHPDAVYTQVPARDGIASGSIKRSNKFPNCSYFHTWTNVVDTISWPVEVAMDGRYEVRLLYTCPQADLGSDIELSFGDARLRATIDEGKDGPLLGRAEDRFPRVESYVKEWHNKILGDIELKAGAGTLTLKALKKAGNTVMDFRLLELKRL